MKYSMKELVAVAAICSAGMVSAGELEDRIALARSAAPPSVNC